MTLILLRSSNGARLLDRPRDMPGYEGRGASTALCIALERAGAALSAASDRGRPTAELQRRAYVLHEMALEQVEREQARGRMAAE